MILGIEISAWIAAIVALIAIGVSLVKLGMKLKDKKQIEPEEVTDVVHDLSDIIIDLKENYEDNKDAKSLKKQWIETNKPLTIKRQKGARPILRTEDDLSDNS